MTPDHGHGVPYMQGWIAREIERADVHPMQNVRSFPPLKTQQEIDMETYQSGSRLRRWLDSEAGQEAENVIAWICAGGLAACVAYGAMM